MASGPPLIGDNRFALLADRSPQRKRKKRNRAISPNEFPPLPIQKPLNHKYVVVSSTNENKPLSEYSCFAIHRSLYIISKDILSISQLRDGKLLLLVKDNLTAKKFLEAKVLPGVCSITCKLHEQLNFTKGTIYAPYLSKIPDREIVEELSSQGVVEIYKFERVVDGKKVHTGVVLLTFDLYHLPESIDISWYKVRIREYYPNPMRCKNCQLLGHTVKRCSKTPLCENCSLPPHPTKECTRTYCANCAEEHPSSSNKCTKFIQQKEILKIKIKRKCTMREAISIYREQNRIVNSPTSFSAVASSNISAIPSTTLANNNISPLIEKKTIASTTNLLQNGTSKTNLNNNQQSKIISPINVPSDLKSSNNQKEQEVNSKSSKNHKKVIHSNNNEKENIKTATSNQITKILKSTTNYKQPNTTSSSKVSLNNSAGYSYRGISLSEPSSDLDSVQIEFMATDDESE